MAVVITSTTSAQKDMDHAVSDNWREAPPEEVVPEVAPAPEKEPVEPEAKESETETKPEPEQAAKPKEHKSGWQRRVDKLVAQNHQLKSQLEELQSKAKPAEEAAKVPEGPKEPKLSDFEGDVEKFVAARDAWKDASETQAARAEQHKAIVAEYNKKASEALGRYDDWNEVVSGADIIMPQASLDAIIESDNGPDVAYYLAQHPDEALALSELTPIRAIQAIARISDKVAAELAPQPKPPKAKVPEPIKPVGNSATRHSTMEEIPIREYIKLRNKQEREARRG